MGALYRGARERSMAPGPPLSLAPNAGHHLRNGCLCSSSSSFSFSSSILLLEADVRGGESDNEDENQIEDENEDEDEIQDEGRTAESSKVRGHTLRPRPA